MNPKKTFINAKRFITESAVFKKYLINTSWFFIEKIIRIFFSFGVSILLARYLGPDDFGLLSFAISYATLGVPISNLGLDSILIKEFVAGLVKDNEIIGSALVLRLFGTVIVNLVLYIIYLCFIVNAQTSAIEKSVVLIILISNFFQIFNVLEFYFQAKVKYKLATLSLTVSMLVSNVARVVLILIEADLVYFAYTYLLEFFTLNAFLLIYSKKGGTSPKNWSFNKAFSSQLLKESWPLVLSSVMVTIYMKIDQVMIKEILGNVQVGFYSTGIKFSEFFYFLPIAVSRSLNPLLAKNFNQDEEFYEHRLKVIMGITFWGFLAIAIVLHLFSEEIITLLFGMTYLPAHKVLAIHGYAGMITGMSVFLSQRYVLKLSTAQSFWGTLFGAAVNLILNLILIPKLGPAGAAWATVISYHVPTLFIGIFFDRKVLTLSLSSIYYPLVAKKYKIYN